MVHPRTVAVAVGLAWALAACGSSAAPSSPTPSPAGPTRNPNAVPETIAELTQGVTQMEAFIGQSVTVPPGPALDHIRFSWNGRRPPATPVNYIAFGTLFLLSQEYLGLPEHLGAVTPGFIARSLAIENGEYVFEPTLVLQPGRQYWFYTNAVAVTLGTSFFTLDQYPGGDLYSSPIGATDPTPFARLYVRGPEDRLDANFRLRAFRVP